MNRIEQLISDMEQYVDSCKTQAFSGNRKIIVERGAIDDFLAELRMCMPEVVQRSEKIVDNKEAIISDAKTQADKLLDDARIRTDELIDEHEIVQQAIQRGNEIVAQANEQAQEILNQAIREANSFKESALSYTDDAMSSLRRLYGENINETKKLFEQYMGALEERYQIISSNHDDFLTSVNGTGTEQAAPQEDEDEYNE